MLTRIHSTIHKLAANSKRIFLIDGSGAFFTAFFLFAVLASFEESFGMPRNILYFLSFVACIYTVYSFSCYFFVSKKKPFLKAVILANIIYCCITIGLVIYFYHSLTILGLIYFFLEVVVMTGLIGLELMVVARI